MIITLNTGLADAASKNFYSFNNFSLKFLETLIKEVNFDYELDLSIRFWNSSSIS